MDDKLTIKQQKFIREAAACGNATASVVSAGYQVATRKSASAIASQLLAKPKIQAALADELRALRPSLEFDVASWLVASLEAPLKGAANDTGAIPAMSWPEKLSALAMIARFSGNEPTRKIAKTTVKIKLPGSSDE